MKPKITFLAIAIFPLLTITGCKKDKDNSGTFNEQFSATVSNVNYNPSVVAAFSQYTFVQVQGLEVKAGDSISMRLAIPEDADVNSAIELGFSGGQLDFINTKGTADYGSQYGLSHGSITVTSWDKENKKIVGNFSAVLYGTLDDDSVVIANGRFNTTYEE